MGSTSSGVADRRSRGVVGVSAETLKIERNGVRHTIFTLERSISMMSLRMRSFA
jgi:hypothetical protein